MRFFAEDLDGRPVFDRTGRHVGKVSDVEIDSSSWTVTGVRVSLDREVADRIGVDKPLLGRGDVVFARDSIEGVSDAVTLRDTADEIARRIEQR